MDYVDKIQQAWDAEMPISIIANQLGMKVAEVKFILGDQYTKLENHYHYVNYRDKKNHEKIVEWFNNNFKKEDLQAAIQSGKVSDYLNIIAKQNKVSATAVRNYLIEKVGPIPKKSKKPKGPYRIGVKSKAFGKDREIAEQFEQGMTKEALAKKYHIAKRTVQRVVTAQQLDKKTPVHKLIEAQNYDVHTLIGYRVTGQWTMFAKQEAKRLNITYKYLEETLRKIYPEIEQFKKHKKLVVPKTPRGFISDKQKKLITKLYLEDLLTINEIAKKTGVSWKGVKKWLNESKVEGLFENERQRKLFSERGKIISRTNTNNPNLKQEHINQRSIHAVVPFDYMTSMPTWAWVIVERQPGIDVVAKLINLFNSPREVSNLLQQAEHHLGRKINYSSISGIIPLINGVNKWNTIISVNGVSSDSKVIESSGTMSSYEAKVASIISTAGVKYLFRTKKVIPSMELDFYIPSRKLAIEVSPLSTHNSNEFVNYGMKTAAPKTQSYHQQKAKACREHGIRLITLFEKDLVSERWNGITGQLLKMLIAGHAERTYYGREVKIYPIKATEAKFFCEENHLDGYVSSKYKYGIFSNNSELLGVFTLGTPRGYSDRNWIELKRMAWKNGVQVRYGISKILSFIEKEFSERYDGLITYSSNNIGWGEGYKKSGAELIGETQPRLTYVNPRNPEDNYSWQVATPWGAKQGILANYFGPKEMTTKEAKEKVETELPHRDGKGKGYVAQYDCGNRIWLFKF